mgnify:CR=1 FL=1
MTLEGFVDSVTVCLTVYFTLHCQDQQQQQRQLSAIPLSLSIAITVNWWWWWSQSGLLPSLFPKLALCSPQSLYYTSQEEQEQGNGDGYLTYVICLGVHYELLRLRLLTPRLLLLLCSGALVKVNLSLQFSTFSSF